MTHVGWFLVVFAIWMGALVLAFKLMDKDEGE